MACPMGQRILELLEQKDMKQKDLAQKLGITEVSVSRYINGTHTPHTDIVVKMADILGVSADYLLGRSVSKHPTSDPRDIIAAHRKDNKLNDLPPEAIAEIDAYIDFIKHKYKKQSEDKK